MSFMPASGRGRREFGRRAAGSLKMQERSSGIRQSRGHNQSVNANDALQKFWAREQRMRDLMDPPAIRRMRESEQRMRDLMDPPAIRRMREYEQRAHDLFDPPTLRRMREYEQRARDLMDPPAMRRMREYERARQLLESNALTAFSEQRRQLGRMLRASGLEHLTDYQDLHRGVPRSAQAHTANAEADPPGDSKAAGAVGEAHVGFPDHVSAQLYSDIEGMIKSLFFLLAAVEYGRLELDLPVSRALISLLLTLVAAADLAYYISCRHLSRPSR